MKLVVVTDAWSPQVNGVVNTLLATRRELEKLGLTVEVLSPEGFTTLPCPTYPDIRLSLFPGAKVRAMLDDWKPDYIHIATEGPLGLAARRYCLTRDLPFNTAYHTKFPEYIYARCRLPLSISYAWIRWFHRPSRAVMVPTQAIKRELAARNIGQLEDWSRGVDPEIFRPTIRDAELTQGVTKPIFLYVGRVAIEKNIEAFLQLDLPGIKWVVGVGPQLKYLQQKYPEVSYFGLKTPQELARYYQSADVFVFPSLTDTFGLVLLEAMACGTPVAAFPVPGPIDVVENNVGGVLDNDLRSACLRALDMPRAQVADFAKRFTWENCSRQFYDILTRSQTKGGQAGKAKDTQGTPPPVAQPYAHPRASDS